MVRESGIQPRGPASRGAEVIAHVLSAGLTGQASGTYFDELRPAHADSQAYDLGVRRVLRERTITMFGPFLEM